MLISDIIAAIEQEAPLSLQESYDNAGMQVGDKSALCTGVLLCVDVTPSVIDEAIERDCNLVVSHHPLIFRGLKHITGATPQELAIIKAITAGVAVYSAHTNLDSASRGVNYTLARRLGIAKPSPLECPDPANPGIGLGAVGNHALQRPALQHDNTNSPVWRFGRVAHKRRHSSQSTGICHLRCQISRLCRLFRPAVDNRHRPLRERNVHKTHFLSYT